MKCKVDKKIKVNLSLTQEEFNTIVVAFGITNHNRRLEQALEYDVGLEIIKDGDVAQDFYSELLKIAKSI